MALRSNLVDVPNARSSHMTPTPRGGGIAIATIVLGALLLLAAGTNGARHVAPLIALAGAAVAAIGLVDDRRGVTATKRFFVHCLAVTTLLFATRDIGKIDLPAIPDWPGAQVVVAAICLLWLVNLFNFMDGIDGLAGMEAAFVSLGLAACISLIGARAAPLVFLCLATGGASLGFLIFNWPPAKIFMGDVGSGFVGFMLGALAVLAHREIGLSAWVPMILLAVFVSDATVTLVRRVVRGERWYAAHRSHAYQRLSRRFGNHRSVTLGALIVNLFWLLPLAMAATRWPSLGGVLAAIAYLPLIVAVIWAGAGEVDGGAPQTRSY